MFQRMNGITQETATNDADECCRSGNNSVVVVSSTATTQSRSVNTVDFLPSETSSAHPPDVVQLNADEQATTQAQSLRINSDANSSAARDNLAVAGDVIRRSVEPTLNGCEARQFDRSQSATTCFSSTPLNVTSQVLELSANPCSGSRTGTQSTTAREFQVPVQRSSSTRDASRPPLHPRSCSPGVIHWRRSATPSRPVVADCLLGLTTVGGSRTSSCEVLVGDDDARLSDIITRRSGLTRRSSCTSSAAEDVDSIAASETDSSVACCDLDDQLSNSLLDRLLMRLRSTPRDSPSCGRRPSIQTSVSWSSDDEEVDPSRSNVGTTVRHVLPSWISRKHCSLLSSLDDVTSDSDFELGSSLSQLMMTSGKSPRHPSASNSREDKHCNAAASVSCVDLARFRREPLVSCRDLLDSSEVNSLNGELVNCATAEFSHSQPAEVHIARTSRVLMS